MDKIQEIIEVHRSSYDGIVSEYSMADIIFSQRKEIDELKLDLEETKKDYETARKVLRDVVKRKGKERKGDK